MCCTAVWGFHVIQTALPHSGLGTINQPLFSQAVGVKRQELCKIQMRRQRDFSLKHFWSDVPLENTSVQKGTVLVLRDTKTNLDRVKDQALMCVS